MLCLRMGVGMIKKILLHSEIPVIASEVKQSPESGRGVILQEIATSLRSSQ